MTAPNNYRYTVFFVPTPNFTGLLAIPERPWTVGGTGQTCAILTRALSRRGDTEIILLLDKPQDFSPNVPRVEARVLQSMISRGVPYLSRKLNKNTEKNNFRHQGKQAIVFFSTSISPSLVSRIKAQHIPLAFWVNGDSLVDKSSLIPATAQKQNEGFLEFANYIIAQNKYQQQKLQDIYGHDSTFLMPCLVEFPAMSTAKSNQDTSLTNRPTLLWAGRCSGVKRPWFLTQLAQLIPELNFKLVMSQMTDNQYDRAIRLDLSRCPNVEVINGLPHEELMNLYHEDIIVINTSASEGLPNTYIEAAQAQRPFVSLEVDLGGLLDDGFREESLGLCAHGDLNLMVQQIRKLATDPERRLRIGRAASDYAYKQWNADKIAAQWIAFMDTL